MRYILNHENYKTIYRIGGEYLYSNIYCCTDNCVFCRSMQSTIHLYSNKPYIMPLQLLNYRKIFDFGLHAYTLIKTRDPCKKCLVKACCSISCEHKVLLDNFLFPSNAIYKHKILIIIASIHWLVQKYNIYDYMLIALAVILFILSLFAIVGFVVAP